MIYKAFHSFILSFFLFLSEYVSPELTSDCSRRRRRIASGSRSPSRRSPCGTGSYTDSYRRAKRLMRRPQELIGSPASFGIMLGTPTAFERKSERGFFNLVHILHRPKLNYLVLAIVLLHATVGELDERVGKVHVAQIHQRLPEEVQIWNLGPRGRR